MTRVPSFFMAFMAMVLGAAPAVAQEIPANYKQVLETLGKTGDFKDNVLKVNIRAATWR